MTWHQLRGGTGNELGGHTAHRQGKIIIFPWHRPRVCEAAATRFLRGVIGLPKMSVSTAAQSQGITLKGSIKTVVEFFE